MTSKLSHDSITEALRKSGSVFAEDEAQLLISSTSSHRQLSQMVENRIQGVPLQIILGWAEFHGMRVGVGPGVFIPRIRSEFLVDQAISKCKGNSVVVDLCCGSGAIGMAMISTLPQIRLFASDIDATAVQCARGNIGSIGGQVFQGDLFDALPTTLKGRIEVLVANAPYVPTKAIELMPLEARMHEPLQTLDGGLDGLDVHRKIAGQVLDWLAPSGYILIETGEDQAEQMAAIFTSNRLDAEIVSSPDYETTVVIGRKR